MKVVALLLCGLAVAAANEHWENFKIKHGKSYANLEDESYRKSVYERNQKIIDAHNERFRQGLVTFDMAMNQFGDMTQEEIASTMNGLRNVESCRNGHQENPIRQVHQLSKPLVNDIDWREKGAVTPVVDQGLLCESWAISATGALEGQHFLQSGELVKLSEQNLIDCVPIPDYGVSGCSGGIVVAAFEYVRDNGGIDTEASYPCGSCTGTCCFDPATIGATCTGYVDILVGSEPALQDAVQNVCPVSVAIDASHMSFQFYSSGIYYEPSCSSQMVDHAVLTVGFGEESGNDYWIVKNSWGTSWGEAGYIRMARNQDNNCGIASSASYPTV